MNSFGPHNRWRHANPSDSLGLIGTLILIVCAALFYIAVAICRAYTWLFAVAPDPRPLHGPAPRSLVIPPDDVGEWPLNGRHNRPTPTGSRPSAQGCDTGATLGIPSRKSLNPERVAPPWNPPRPRNHRRF